jgi:PBP1b-binding outer membrane lipoprotein LpoB
MIRKFTAAIALTAALVLSGCASVPMASQSADTQAKSFRPATDQASLYIYRNESLGRAVKMAVLIDDKPVGTTVAESYIHQTLPPGKHVIVSKAENDTSVSIDMKAGQTYVVWQEVKMGFVSARSALHVVDAQKGQTGVQQCTLIQSPSHDEHAAN